jgi:hypothetical protein
MESLIASLKTNLKNIPGWHTKRKIVVFESDDWGGIRMPSKEVYEILKNAGIEVNRSRYRFDTLASSEDLEQLFSVLEKVKDSRGKPAVITPFTNVANPDFKKIKECGFQEYYYEKFTDTLLNYGRGEGVFNMWKQGMEASIFVPELHGREHVTVQLWLKKLREGNQHLQLAFDLGVTSVYVPGGHPAANEFRPEFYFDSESQKAFLKNSILDGILLFNEIFGYIPRAFAPSNGIFHPEFEEDVASAGVKFLNVNIFNSFPTANGKLKTKYYITGRENKFGSTYYTRNCAFEPTDESYQGIQHTLDQVRAAFKWGKPAQISTHRVNFVGTIEPENRRRGLKELKMLLEEIVKRWPDVEFMSTGDALLLLKESNLNSNAG